jgi:hypothetical protein
MGYIKSYVGILGSVLSKEAHRHVGLEGPNSKHLRAVQNVNAVVLIGGTFGRTA